MGDKGGKKDKTKHQQQLATKQKQKDQQKQDKAPSTPPGQMNPHKVARTW